MKSKGNCVVLSMTIVILGMCFLSLPTRGNGQYLTLASATAASSTTENASTQSATITLTGQIIPAVNTGPDAGIGSYGMPDNQIRQPMEYHLYDQQNRDVKLSFDYEQLNSLIWQKWLDDNPQKEQIQAQATQRPPLWDNYPIAILDKADRLDKV